MTEVLLFRLYLLRAIYALVAAGGYRFDPCCAHHLTKLIGRGLSHP